MKFKGKNMKIGQNAKGKFGKSFKKEKLNGKMNGKAMESDDDSELGSSEDDSYDDDEIDSSSGSGREVGASDDDMETDDEDVEDEDVKDESNDEEDDDDNQSENGEEDDWLESQKHKKALSNLEKTDPEFYKFLQENDKKLLQFDVSDSDEETDEDEKYHKPPEELEVDSEESDYEREDGEERDEKVVTLAMVKTWRDELISNPSVQTITRAVDIFHSALDRVTGEDSAEYKVEGSAVFNTVIEMCVMHLQRAAVEFLKLTPTTIKHPEKSKKWVKIKSVLQSYFTDLFRLLQGVSSEHITSVMLKHLHSCCSFVACYKKLSKQAIKHLTTLWSTGEETVRVLAYLCILRLTTMQKSALLNTALKLMYIAYIRSSRFVSMNTMPQINFMKQTLVDLFSLDPPLSYQHAFLYIRQLAIHLRNAITIHKKENFQSVYNWQYIHSLRLWIDLLCVKKDSSELRQLLYPLVQIILGCIKLIPTAQYFPLRFHCIQMLIKLGRETETYIPVLPLITESLLKVDFKKPMKKASMKPFDLTFVLRLSKGAMTETAFTDAVIEYVFQLLMESTASYSHSIAFPDLIVPTVVQLKTFLKECKTAKYASKFKQVLVKIEENSNMINANRNKLTLKLNETEKIKSFETEMKSKGTPLQKYWEQVRKSNLIKKSKQATNNTKIANEGMPKIPKTSEKLKRNKATQDGPAELFPSDESDFEFPDLENGSKPKKAKKKSAKKAKKEEETNVEEDLDIIKEEDDVSDLEDLVEELDINTF